MSIRKIIPKPILLLYHKALAILACLFYRFPSRKLITIGVTGTNGKTTTVHMISHILERAGLKVGMVSTVSFKIGRREWLNKTRMTMLGRFQSQKFLRQLLKKHCQYAVLEVSSEGMAQGRGGGIDFDLAVLTNLRPEHLESHGSFENYKEAKGKLFKALKSLKPALKNKKVSIVNLDDENAEYFFEFEADEKWGYKIIQNSKFKIQNHNSKLKTITAESYQLYPDGINFNIQNTSFYLPLLGKFNLYNALAAICVGLSQGIKLETIRQALSEFKGTPGRLEKIEEGQRFTVIVDYAHTPDAFKELFETLTPYYHGQIITVFGSAGGGRDKAKRPKLGKIASRYSDWIILTNEDPYDTFPQEIVDDIARGIEEKLKIKNEKFKIKEYFKILDRREAIKKALNLAQEGDLVLILGKGTEPCIKIGKRKIPWDDRDMTRQLLRESTHNIVFTNSLNYNIL